MTTLNKLRAQCKRLLSGGTPPKDSKLNDDYIIEELRQVGYGLMKLEYYAGKNEGRNGVTPLAIATYPGITVSNDTLRKRNYSLLPAFAMNVAEGVQQVKPQTGIPGKDVAMIPIDPQEYELFKSLTVGAEIMRDQFTFEVDRDKVWYSKKSDKTLLESNITLVEMRILVHDPAQLSAEDPYPIPPEMEAEMVKGVLMLHGYTPQKAADLINNDNPNT
jgi:hypothetical protein